MRVRAPWKEKNYRPLSFTKGFGRRVSDGKLHLSLGRGRPRIDLPIPVILDSATGDPVPPEMWGKIQLCWDQDALKFLLHIPYQSEGTSSVGQGMAAIDESITNGREARAVKRQRNKSVGELQRKLSQCKMGHPCRLLPST